MNISLYSTIISVLAITWSLAARFMPGMKTWYKSLNVTKKRMVNLIAFTASSFFLSLFANCYGPQPIQCVDQMDLVLASTLSMALLANGSAEFAHFVTNLFENESTPSETFVGDILERLEKGE